MNELQQTDEWIAARLGKVTASRIADMLATTKTGWGASRKNLMAELISERGTGTQYPHYVSPEMKRGIDMQPMAVAEYEKRAKILVGPIGFVPHPRIAMAGCSPDGLVGDDGLVEFKCPNTWTHIEMLRTKTIESRYVLQMQFQLACTNRHFVDFVSYDDRMKSAQQYICIRCPRNDKTITMIEAETIKFLGEIEQYMDALDMEYPG